MAAYTISVPEDKLATLKLKLEHATFPDELPGAGWSYGAPLSEIRRLTEAWKTFDWRAVESRLNALPNFHRRVPVAGFGEIDLHYLHQPSPHPDAIPLLFVHGWPGSYFEVTKMLPALAETYRGVSFHVVAPSLPNFGWSAGVPQRGFALAQYAEACDQLMQALVYRSYVTQGGDWGFYITRTLGMLYPARVKASHLNMTRGHPPRFFSQPLLYLRHAFTTYNERERSGFERLRWFETEGSGYKLLQGTKPQTLGYALQDSPVALLAWIYEKLHDWTDAYGWSDEEILTWVSLYYFSTAGPAASVRIYYETVHTKPPGLKPAFTRERAQTEYVGRVKLGIMHSPKELSVVPSSWMKTLGPVVHESFQEKGGHFAAWENPNAVVSDLRAMFGKGGPCYRIVEPKARL